MRRDSGEDGRRGERQAGSREQQCCGVFGERWILNVQRVGLGCQCRKEPLQYAVAESERG